MTVRIGIIIQWRGGAQEPGAELARFPSVHSEVSSHRSPEVKGQKKKENTVLRCSLCIGSFHCLHDSESGQRKTIRTGGCAWLFSDGKTKKEVGEKHGRFLDSSCQQQLSHPNPCTESFHCIQTTNPTLCLEKQRGALTEIYIGIFLGGGVWECPKLLQSLYSVKQIKV